MRPTYAYLEFPFKWRRQAKTFTIRGDEDSNATVCQVRHCGAKALWGNFTEEVVFESYWVRIPGRLNSTRQHRVGKQPSVFWK